MEVFKEECVYKCGGILVPEDHVRYGTVFVQPKVTCAAPVVAHYFVARSTFKSVCFHCGDEDIFPISDELKKKTFSQFIQFVIHAKEMVLMNAPEVLDLLNGNLKLMHCAKH